jgi:hypothetical protein
MLRLGGERQAIIRKTNVAALKHNCRSISTWFGRNRALSTSKD